MKTPAEDLSLRSENTPQATGVLSIFLCKDKEALKAIFDGRGHKFAVEGTVVAVEFKNDCEAEFFESSIRQRFHEELEFILCADLR